MSNETKFYVASRGDYEVTETNAKTLRGAKNIASRMFQKSTGGRFDVKIKTLYGFETVAYWSGESWSWINQQ